MSSERVVVRKSTYFDSISLMLASQSVGSEEGVEVATAFQATPLNIGMLAMQGFQVPEDLGPNDLVIAIRAKEDATLDEAMRKLDVALIGSAKVRNGVGPREARSWRSVKSSRPETTLGVIAVPGRNAAAEGAAALEAGVDVFCFSDGVPIEHEVALKRWAVAEGRLFMGPDCGTAIIDGVGLGFTNRVNRGPVGIVGASGTGTQELCALLDRAGLGISHAIGVGSRDLSSSVGGLMTLQALDLLAEDESTEAIVVVSKPPEPEVASRIARRAAAISKPVVIAALGPRTSHEPADLVTTSMESAIAKTCDALGRTAPEVKDPSLPSTDGGVRGLFCGGTLCYQAQLVLHDAGVSVNSNVPLDPSLRLKDPWVSEGHTFIDFGEDEFTDGRLHPMIDTTLRDARARAEVEDPAAGLILCDVVLGDGAHPDPAEGLAQVIEDADRPDLSFVVVVCGTPKDPQGLDRQIGRLEEAGAAVTLSSESAARAVVAALNGNA